MNKKVKNKVLSLPKQGEIWLVEFPKVKESRKPARPCLVISDNVQNECDEWIVVIPLTTEDIKQIEPFEVYIENTKETGLNEPSKIQFIYPFTIDKELRLVGNKPLGKIDRRIIEQAKQAWKIAFEVEEWQITP